MADLIESRQEDQNDFLKSQMSEAWTHYRHCETMRAEYLKMFFTGYLAFAGFLVTLFKPDGKSQPHFELWVAVAALSVVVFCFSSVFYILVVRLNIVLVHYGRVMKHTRALFFGDEGVMSDIWSYKTIGLHDRDANKFFSVGSTVPRLIIFLSGCLILVQAAIAFELRREQHRGAGSLVIVSAMTMTVGLTYLCWRGELAQLGQPAMEKTAMS